MKHEICAIPYVDENAYVKSFHNEENHYVKESL